MANEQDQSGSLTASVGEQLREKSDSAAAGDAGREAAARRQAQLDRHKRDERDFALRQAHGDPRPRPRRAYRETPPNAWWWAAIATLLVGFACGVRGKKLLSGTGLVLLVARFALGARDRAEQDRVLAANAATAR